MDKIPFFSPIVGDCSSSQEKAVSFNIAETYFDLGQKYHYRKVVCFSDKGVVVEKVEVKLTAWRAAEIALKTLSFFLVIIPIIMLGFKVVYRLSNEFVLHETYQNRTPIPGGIEERIKQGTRRMTNLFASIGL